MAANLTASSININIPAQGAINYYPQKFYTFYILCFPILDSFIHSFILFILEIKIQWYKICPSSLYIIEIKTMTTNTNLLET
jgi:hypothetical protein